MRWKRLDYFLPQIESRKRTAVNTDTTAGAGNAFSLGFCVVVLRVQRKRWVKAGLLHLLALAWWMQWRSHVFSLRLLLSPFLSLSPSLSLLSLSLFLSLSPLSLSLSLSWSFSQSLFLQVPTEFITAWQLHSFYGLIPVDPISFLLMGSKRPCFGALNIVLFHPCNIHIQQLDVGRSAMMTQERCSCSHTKNSRF